MTGRIARLGLSLALGLAASVSSEESMGAAPKPMRNTADRLGLNLQQEQPITITAESLEASRDDAGGERILFQKDVRVVQGDLSLDCDWLQAWYPEGTGSRPDKVVARGNVRIRQTETEVRCSQAVFTDATCKAVCTSSMGPAVVTRGDSLIEGERITLDLCSGVLKVKGGRVQLPGTTLDKPGEVDPAPEPEAEAVVEEAP